MSGVLWARAARADGCSPCLKAGRAEYLDCASSATGEFVIARHLCMRRDSPCEKACVWRHYECLAATGTGAALAACESQTQAAKAACRTKYAVGSKKRANCIDQAQVAGFQCRYDVRRTNGQAVARCKAELDACSRRCDPGDPPGGVDVCHAAARDVFKGMLSQCKETFQTSRAACLNKDQACTQDCRDTRDACTAPVQDGVAAAIQNCTVARDAAAAVCRGANPAGSPALDQCLETADTNAFICRDTATTAAAPALAACEQQFIGCAAACPAPSAATATVACGWHNPYARPASVGTRR